MTQWLFRPPSGWHRLTRRVMGFWRTGRARLAARWMFTTWESFDVSSHGSLHPLMPSSQDHCTFSPPSTTPVASSTFTGGSPKGFAVCDNKPPELFFTHRSPTCRFRRGSLPRSTVVLLPHRRPRGQLGRFLRAAGTETVILLTRPLHPC